MKTDPTSNVSGVAGMPLSYEAIRSGRDMSARNTANSKSNDAISDTLETSDREADGRQAWGNKSTMEGQSPNTARENGSDDSGNILDIAG